MLTSDTSTSNRFVFNTQLFAEQVERISKTTLNSFKQITLQYSLFQIAFFALGVVELFAFVLFFSYLTKSTIFAFSIAGLFFTGFAYFVLLFYFQAKKPQQLLQLRHVFINECKTALPFEASSPEYHLALIEALYHLVAQFHRQEYNYYKTPEALETLSLLAQKFSVWTHWKDVHQMKELLIHMIIKEYIHLVQLKPTDLETHAGLASAYLSLSKLYTDPRKVTPDEPHIWVSPEYGSHELQDKFKNASHRAIEELRILDAYSPNDPWVHIKLATIYQHLNMTHEEINEYETILTLSPKDQTTLFRLGALYFSQGQHATALRLYERLMPINSSKAEELLTYYGTSFNE